MISTISFINYLESFGLAQFGQPFEENGYIIQYFADINLTVQKPLVISKEYIDYASAERICKQFKIVYNQELISML